MAPAGHRQRIPARRRALQLSARNLPVASAGRLAGYRDVGGTVALMTSAECYRAARALYSDRSVAPLCACRNKTRLPSLAIDAAGMDGCELTADGGVSGPKGERIGFNGRCRCIAPGAFSISVPPQGRLAMRFKARRAGQSGGFAAAWAKTASPGTYALTSPSAARGKPDGRRSPDDRRRALRRIRDRAVVSLKLDLRATATGWCCGVFRRR